MKNKAEMKRDLLEYYKNRANCLKSVDTLKDKVAYYNRIINNFDELYDSLLSDLIDNKINDIFHYINHNIRAFDAIKLVDSGLNSLGIIDSDTELLSLFKSYNVLNRNHIKETITKIILELGKSLLTSLIWYIWPLWKGLYSQIIPTVTI